MSKKLKPLKITERILAPLRNPRDKDLMHISKDRFRRIKGPNGDGFYAFFYPQGCCGGFKNLLDLLDAVYDFGVVDGKNELRQQLKTLMIEKDSV